MMLPAGSSATAAPLLRIWLPIPLLLVCQSIVQRVCSPVGGIGARAAALPSSASPPSLPAHALDAIVTVSSAAACKGGRGISPPPSRGVKDDCRVRGGRRRADLARSSRGRHPVAPAKSVGRHASANLRGQRHALSRARAGACGESESISAPLVLASPEPPNPDVPPLPSIPPRPPAEWSSTRPEQAAVVAVSSSAAALAMRVAKRRERTARAGSSGHRQRASMLQNGGPRTGISALESLRRPPSVRRRRVVGTGRYVPRSMLLVRRLAGEESP